MNDAGLWIQVARIKKKMSQKQLADALHINPQRIGSWERGTRTISRKYADEVANVLGVPPPEVIVPGTPEPRKTIERIENKVPGGEWLRLQCWRRGISRAALADTIGVTQHTVLRWERGVKIPYRHLFLILDHLCMYKILPSVLAAERNEKEKLEAFRSAILQKKLREIDINEQHHITRSSD